MSSCVFLDPWRVSSVNSRHSFTAIEPLANKRPESSLSSANTMSGGNAIFRIKNAVAKGDLTIIKACSSSRLSSNTLSQHPFQISTHPNKLNPKCPARRKSMMLRRRSQRPIRRRQLKPLRA
ncbi:hypothetical protein FRB95_009346 [Tulasnella sp. JGI-2019a]|nr:hypothetical protein FRB95_009346 [Tulasnella sp. JGI-2019a]